MCQNLRLKGTEVVSPDLNLPKYLMGLNLPKCCPFRLTMPIMLAELGEVGAEGSGLVNVEAAEPAEYCC